MLPRVLQCDVVLHFGEVWCTVMQHGAVFVEVRSLPFVRCRHFHSQLPVVRFIRLKCVAVCCSVLQCVAVCCSMVYCVAAHCG